MPSAERHPADLATVTAMKSGDQSALAELYDRYASVVYAVALRVLGDTGAAAACRLELEQVRGDGALLALSTAGPRPPVRVRQRLLDTVAKEAASAPTLSQKTRKDGATGVVPPRKSWWGLLGWAATAAVLVFAASLWKENAALRSDVSTWRNVASQQELELGHAHDVVATLTSSDVQRVTLVSLVSVKTPPQPQGKAFYLRNRSSLLFIANNLPPLPPQKAYELWLIPVQGAPIPAGVFKPDAHGSATVVNPPLPGGAEAKAFAITVENEAGATSPTMPIVMMGTGE